MQCKDLVGLAGANLIKLEFMFKLKGFSDIINARLPRKRPYPAKIEGLRGRKNFSKLYLSDIPYQYPLERAIQKDDKQL